MPTMLVFVIQSRSIATNQAGSPILANASRNPSSRTGTRLVLVGPASASTSAETCHERFPIPVEVVRQPLSKLEVALASRPVAPCRRDFRDAPPGDRRLDGELERQLEPGGALDGDGVEEATRIQLEVVGRVVCAYAREPVERPSRSPAHQPLEEWPADLAAATHV